MTPSSEQDPKSSHAAASNVVSVGPAGAPLVGVDSSIFKDIQVDLRARLGEARMSVDELLALRTGSIVKLDAKLNSPVELRLNGSVVARGEIVAVGDQFGLRIIEIARPS